MKRQLYLFMSVFVMSVLIVPMTGSAGDWSTWTNLSDEVSVSYNQVKNDTWTWKFRNDNPRKTITYMKFAYTDKNGTHNDILPGNLKPGEVCGGWSAFTADSKPQITITEIKRDSESNAATGEVSATHFNQSCGAAIYDAAGRVKKKCQEMGAKLSDFSASCAGTYGGYNATVNATCETSPFVWAYMRSASGQTCEGARQSFEDTMRLAVARGDYADCKSILDFTTVQCDAGYGDARAYVKVRCNR